MHNSFSANEEILTEKKGKGCYVCTEIKEQQGAVPCHVVHLFSISQYILKLIFSQDGIILAQGFIHLILAYVENKQKLLFSEKNISLV